MGCGGDGVTGAGRGWCVAAPGGDGDPRGECGHQGAGDGLPGPFVRDVGNDKQRHRDREADPGGLGQRPGPGDAYAGPADPGKPAVLTAACDLPQARDKSTSPRNDVLTDRRPVLYTGLNTGR